MGISAPSNARQGPAPRLRWRRPGSALWVPASRQLPALRRIARTAATQPTVRPGGSTAVTAAWWCQSERPIAAPTWSAIAVDGESLVWLGQEEVEPHGGGDGCQVAGQPGRRWLPPRPRREPAPAPRRCSGASPGTTTRRRTRPAAPAGPPRPPPGHVSAGPITSSQASGRHRRVTAGLPRCATDDARHRGRLSVVTVSRHRSSQRFLRSPLSS